ncbi:hypothetical protein REPUB_Repub09cG0074200 [Reevesia pubescens]
MAKKKLTHQSKDSKQQNLSQETHDSAKDSTFKKSSNNPLSHQSSMEDPNEKLQNLKSLNSLLVKEAFERRQQIESLVQAKEALEAELSERKEVDEKNVSLELQNGLISISMETQLKEMGVEREREIEVLKMKVNKSSLMKKKLMEMEKNERKFVKEVGTLKVECNKFVGEKKELEKVKSLVVKKKDLLEKNMKDMVKEVESLRKKIEKVAREEKEIYIEKNEQKVKIGEMEKDMQEMSKVILSMRKEEGILWSKVFELKKNYGEAMDREAERAIEIGALVEEKRAKEKSIERLMEEKDFVSRSLEVTMVESDER